MIEKIDRRSRYGNAIIAEDAVSDCHRPLQKPTVFDRHAGAARARVIVVDFEILQGGIGPTEDLLWRRRRYRRKASY